MQPEHEMNILARAAYDAYCLEVGGVAFNGDPLPAFETLDATRKEGWANAAWAAIKMKYAFNEKLLNNLYVSGLSPETNPHTEKGTKTMENDIENRMAAGQFPRRANISKMTAAEKAIFDAKQEVEKMPPDVRLTDAQNHLTKAHDLVADFVDEKQAAE